jgi:hypothetical protein
MQPKEKQRPQTKGVPTWRSARRTIVLSQREAVEAMSLTKRCMIKADPTTCTVIRKRNRRAAPAGGRSLTALSHV